MVEIHTPISFVDHFLSHTRNTGTLLSLSIAIIGFSEFIANFFDSKAKSRIISFLLFVGVLMFVYNIMYSIKSIVDFQDYLKVLKPNLHKYDEVINMYYSKWEKLIIYQVSFVALICVLCLLLIIWVVFRIFNKQIK